LPPARPAACSRLAARSHPGKVEDYLASSADVSLVTYKSAGLAIQMLLFLILASLNLEADII